MDQPFPAYDGDEPYIFVSYAHEDADLVYPEMTRLREQGFNVWYDEGIRPGSTWREEVALALTESKLFLYFITPSSVNSENCHQELNFALSRERKILAVHLVDTKLSIGIELSLSNKQAIIKGDLSDDAYANKLNNAVRFLMPTISPIALPRVQEEKMADAKSIAILPFTNQSSDPENDYLCNGVAEELITGLAKIEGLKLASQLSSFGLKGQNLEPKAIGAKLNVSNVLTGSIQKSGERVRITATLSEVDTGSVLWSERYDGTLEDVFELQEDVANKVIAALKIELGAGSEGPVIDTGTRSTMAYQSFLLGRHEFHKATRLGYLKAHEHFADSVSVDPEFGRAYWLDFISWFLQRNGGFVPQQEFHSRASQVVERMKLTRFEPPTPAVWIDRMLDPSQIPDEKSMAKENLEKVRDGDKEWHGEQFARLAYSLQAAGLLNGARQFFAYYLEHSATHSADTNDPTVVDLESGGSVFGILLFALGRFEKAIDHFSSIIVKEPDVVLALGTRAMLYSRTGQYAKAEADLAELAKTFPRNFPQFYDLYWRRDLDAARAYFEWLDRQRNLASIFKIWGCFLLGYIEKGLDYLEQTDFPPGLLRTRALYPLTPSIIREVTSHPRYRVLLANHGMDDAWRDELMTKVNELESITGIHVSLDEDY